MIWIRQGDVLSNFEITGFVGANAYDPGKSVKPSSVQNIRSRAHQKGGRKVKLQKRETLPNLEMEGLCGELQMIMEKR